MIQKPGQAGGDCSQGGAALPTRPAFLHVCTSVCTCVCVCVCVCVRAAGTGWVWRVPASAALVLPLRSDVQPIPWLSSSHKERGLCLRWRGGGGAAALELGGRRSDSRLLLLLPAFH